MERRSIGVLEVSLAGLGTNNFGRRLDAGATREVVVAALDVGVTHFDTADIYGEGHSEEYLGRALGARRESSGAWAAGSRIMLAGRYAAVTPMAARSGSGSRTKARPLS